MLRKEEDSAWKQILDIYLKDFIDFCFPSVSELIDWNKSWLSLDKELQVIARGNAAKKYLCDKLFKVHLKEGKEQWILVHIEVQGKPQKIFPERMFKYDYRIYDKYQKAILSLAVLTDQRRSWRPDSFQVGIADSYLKSKFMTLKVLDYQDKIASLMGSKNPFVYVIAAQLEAMNANNKDYTQRKQIKLSLIKKLYEIGLIKEDILNLFTFIDWLIVLPEDLELEYSNEVQIYEGEKKMAYVSWFERKAIERGEKIGLERGIARGIEKGRTKALQKVAAFLLKKGFDDTEIFDATGLSKKEIESLKEKEVTA